MSENEIGDFIKSAIDGTSFENTKRNVASVLLHDVVFDTQRAIFDLVLKEHYGPAGALLRVLFEAHVKAVWVARCATEDEIEQLNSDTLKSRRHPRKNMSFQEMIDNIESLTPNMDGKLSEFKKAHWRGLNSLTHSGALQFKNRIQGAEIGKAFAPGFVSDLTEFSSRFTIVSFVYLAFLSKNQELIENALAYSSEKLNIEFDE